MDQIQRATRNLVIKLLSVVVGMFVFAIWIMPPFYTLLCEITGLRKVGGAYEAVQAQVDTSRSVTVQFVATHNVSAPWDFQPEVRRITMHPGESFVLNYIVKNGSGSSRVAQAVPSITPFAAVNYFHKVECFCFESQPLEPGESADLGLLFVLDQDLPSHVTNITLSYTLFDITERSKKTKDVAAVIPGL